MTWFPLVPIEHAAILLGKIAAAVIAFETIRRVLVKPALRELSKLTRMYGSIEAITKEFKPNGGTSLKDAVMRIEVTLQTIDERWRALLNLVPVGFFESDAEGRITFISRAVPAWTNRLAYELKGEGWISMVHPEDREAVEEGWKESVEQHRIYDQRYRYINYDGAASIPVHVRGYPFFNSDKKLLGYMGTIIREDVSNQFCDPALCPLMKRVEAMEDMFINYAVRGSDGRKEVKT